MDQDRKTQLEILKRKKEANVLWNSINCSYSKRDFAKPLQLGEQWSYRVSVRSLPATQNSIPIARNLIMTSLASFWKDSALCVIGNIFTSKPFERKTPVIFTYRDRGVWGGGLVKAKFVLIYNYHQAGTLWLWIKELCCENIG